MEEEVADEEEEEVGSLEWKDSRAEGTIGFS